MVTVHFGRRAFQIVAATYEAAIHMSKIVRDLISLVSPISSTSVVLDNAPDSGVVTQAAKRFSKRSPTIFAADISPALI